MPSARDNSIFFAQLAEQAERYEEMVEAVKRVAVSNVELTVHERNVLSVAYKNAIDARRASLRICSVVERKERSKGNDHQVLLVKRYRRTIEDEVVKICEDVLDVLDKHLIPSTASIESRIFYHRMRGNHYRYLAEYAPEDQRKDFANKAIEVYKFGSDLALNDLPPTHPIRLGLALNFSTFYYEVLKTPDRACHLSKQAFDDAIAELDTLSEESYRDSTLIMQLLRDNLTMWTAETQEKAEKGADSDDSDD